eukprot:TRINITY_DN7304_c0_g2_i1.p1 TRINITY_DN7304_c0_g2~~TRINITY_DN7304_c0_g2_i1.p1  ORF type:complete len:192 (-),score=23.05 TRINITY_DN7304_c0_g2_i1:61-636(-)
MQVNYLLLSLFLLVSSTQARLTPIPLSAPCQANCSIGSGYSDKECEWYSDPEGGMSFLPTGYCRAASCACRIEDVIETARNSTALACVRRRLKEGHLSLSEDLVEEMRFMKEKYCNSVFCSPKYHTFIQEKFFPLAYQLHVRAFADCCCPHSIAPPLAWRLIMFDWKIIPDYCSFVAHSIEGFGRCGCQGW